MLEMVQVMESSGDTSLDDRARSVALQMSLPPLPVSYAGKHWHALLGMPRESEDIAYCDAVENIFRQRPTAEQLVAQTQLNRDAQSTDFEMKKQMYGIKYPWEMLEPYADAGRISRERRLSSPYARVPAQDPADPFSERPNDESASVNRGDAANDRDELPQAWSVWHHRLAEVIRVRYKNFAKGAFAQSVPLRAKVNFTVTSDGHIIEMIMNEKSSNVLFNVLVFQAVKSLDGDQATTHFPAGSKRKFVTVSATLEQKDKDFQASVVPE